MALKRRILSAALAVSVGAGLLSGCGANAGKAETQKSLESDGGSKEAQANSGKEKLTVALSQNSNVENYDTNYLTVLLEKELGADLEFVYLPSSPEDAKSKLSIMISSNTELPDVIINPNLTALEVADYGSKGVFLPMNSYLEDAEYFNQIAEKDRESLIQATTAPDGNIYSLSGMAVEPANLVPYKMWINKTWLDKVDMDMPTTVDEYYNVLKAFLEKDANGNGKADEVGVTGNTTGWGCNPAIFLMNSFTFYNGRQTNGGLALAEDGKTVVAPFAQEGWKKGLEYLNQLCTEGLMPPSVFTQDDKQFTALISSEEPVVGSCTAGGYGYWSGSTENTNFQEMEILPPLKGPDGMAYAAYADYSPVPKMMITKDCKNQDLAFKFGDLFYRRDISLTSRYGEEGVDWSEDPEVCKDYKGLFEEAEGIKCSLAQLNLQWSKVQNKHWYDVAPTYRDLETYKGIDGEYSDDPNARNFRVEYNNGSVEHYYNEHPEKTLPSLIYSLEESDEIAEIQENIKSYVDESMAAFATGNRPISDWDNYLKELENMGLSKWITIAQKVYDRMTSE